MKKFLSGLALAAMLAGQTTAATAAPAPRAAAPVEQSEQLSSDYLLFGMLFAAVVVGVILALDGAGDPTLVDNVVDPVSP